MSARRIILIVAALMITAGTAVVARYWAANQQATVVEIAKPVEKPREKGPMVLVAQVDVPTGAFVKEGLVRWAEWPSDSEVPKSYLTQGDYQLEDFYGSVLRRGVTAGEPFVRKWVIRPGDRGFLAAVLQPGYRAMAIRVNATSGIGGLAFPGDRVDLILTHTVGVGGNLPGDAESDAAESDDLKTRRKSGGQLVSETVLTNVRILAVDQYTNEGEGAPRVAKNATLELTPKQAEMLAVVKEMGTITLSLRSLAKDEEEMERLSNLEDPMDETDPEVGETYTFDSEVSKLIALKRRGRGTGVGGVRKKVVNVTRGNDTKSHSF